MKLDSRQRFYTDDGAASIHQNTYNYTISGEIPTAAA